MRIFRKILIYITPLFSWRFYQSTFLAACVSAVIESSPTTNIIIFQNLYHSDLWNGFLDINCVSLIIGKLNIFTSLSGFLFPLCELCIPMLSLSCKILEGSKSIVWAPCHTFQTYRHPPFFGALFAFALASACKVLLLQP